MTINLTEKSDNEVIKDLHKAGFTTEQISALIKLILLVVKAGLYGEVPEEK